MASDAVRQLLTRPIQLADSLARIADDVRAPSRAECLDLKSRAAALSALFRQAARSPDLYERPTRRVAFEAERNLDRALDLVLRCRAQGSLLRRLFTLVPAAAFKSAAAGLDRSAADVQWLLRVSSEDEVDWLGLPPFASNEPALGTIWIQLAKLFRGAQDKKVEAASFLVSYARDNNLWGKIIIEEGGIPPLLKLLKEGNTEGQLSAAKALMVLAKDRESVEVMVQAGACPVFAKLLKEGSMMVQATVAEAMADFADKYPPCQDVFVQVQSNVVRLLVRHLASGTIDEHSKYAIPSRSSTVQSTVISNREALINLDSGEDAHNQMKYLTRKQVDDKRTDMHTVVQTTMAARPGTNAILTREHQDSSTKGELKAMAAKALWKLAKGNPAICRSITDSSALLCFAVLLDKGPENVQRFCAMAVMEIAQVAEHEPDLRRTAFKPTAAAAKAVVDQLIKIVEKGEYSDLLIPSVISLGCLSKTFRATETRIIGPLVKLLDDREAAVMYEAVMALIKFTRRENHLHKTHAEAVIREGAVPSLIQLVHFGEHNVKMQALALLCLVALHVPESEVLVKNEVLSVLDHASKKGFVVVQDNSLQDMLLEAKAKLDLYQAPNGHNVTLDVRDFHTYVSV